jgi:hypothetical protein
VIEQHIDRALLRRTKEIEAAERDSLSLLVDNFPGGF